MANESARLADGGGPAAGTATINSSGTQNRATSNASTRARSASLLQQIAEAPIPTGAWSGVGQSAGLAPSLADIRRGSISSNESAETRSRRTTVSSRTSRPRAGTRTSTSGALQVPAALLLGTPEERPSVGTAEAGKTDDIPDTTSGRGETEGQSSHPLTRTNKKATPEELSAAGAAPSQDDELDNLADMIFTRGRLNRQFYDASKRAGRQSAQEADTAILSNEDDDLADLDPRPKRRSKNMSSFLGEQGPAIPTTTQTTTATTKSASPASSFQDTSALPPSHRAQPIPNDLGIYPNGYHFPPKKTWGEATKIGLKGFLRFTLTPIGFLIVFYACNVVAWGGMLFLLLCNASPVMCRQSNGIDDCNNINSPRRIWIEYDSQVLTGLFCVTAFGLAPWRFRDLWYWAVWRVGRRQSGLRRLAGYKRGWFRLKGTKDLPEDLGPNSEEEAFAGVAEELIPVPRNNMPQPPLTGARAPPSAYWKLDFVVWCMVWNTFFQVVLCGFMWGYSRYTRPSWATGTFVALGCIIAGVGGIMEFVEGKRVKAIEGVPLLSTAQAMADLETNSSNNEKTPGQTVDEQQTPDGAKEIKDEKK